MDPGLGGWVNNSWIGVVDQSPLPGVVRDPPSTMRAAGALRAELSAVHASTTPPPARHGLRRGPAGIGRVSRPIPSVPRDREAFPCTSHALRL